MAMKSGNRREPAWRKSSHSASTNCVEVARAGSEILVRDTKNPHRMVLNYPVASWAEFVAAAKSGAFGR
jgi:hypothetical protein